MDDGSNSILHESRSSLMRRRLLVTACLGVAVLAVLGTWRLFAPAAATSPPPAPAPVPVVTATVETGPMPIVVAGIGTAVAYNSVAMHAQVTGTIEKIGFVEGQTVHPGSLIAQLDPRPFQAALEQAKANLQRDEAHLANAQANLNRYVPLEQKGFATGQEVGNQTAAVAEMRAAIASDQAAIDNAATQLSYTTITSPIDGVTGIRQVDIGNIVQPTDSTPIVIITQVTPISVVFTLPQKDIPRVQHAMGQGPLTTIALSQDGTSRLDTGTLLLVNNVVSASSGTVQLKATFPNANRTLWPGDFVTVRLVLAQRQDAVSVPLSALQQGQNGPGVFVVLADRTVRLRPVTVDETLDGRALIGKGLQSGDTVVVAGQYRLDDGTHIVPVAADNPHVQNQSPATQGLLQ